ncbi:MAG: RES domain-containing protein [Candidatus Solibacter sp.]
MSGEGARLYGGRYNPKGIPAVYTAQSISLALLEILVHLEKSEIPEDYVAMGIELDRRQVHGLPEEAIKRIEDLALSQRPSLDAFRARVLRASRPARPVGYHPSRVQLPPASRRCAVHRENPVGGTLSF